MIVPIMPSALRTIASTAYVMNPRNVHMLITPRDDTTRYNDYESQRELLQND